MTNKTITIVKTTTEQLLTAHQQGQLTETFHTLSETEKDFVTTCLRPILLVGGSWLAAQPIASPLTLLLQWAITQNRPDAQETLHIKSNDIWLTQKQWRPFLALLSHYSFITIPDFPQHYYRTPNEPVVETLCGLWGIGNSTFYRYLDKGKQNIVNTLWQQWQNGRFTPKLRAFTYQHTRTHFNWQTDADRHTWHQQQIAHFQTTHQYQGIIWHSEMAADFAQLSQLIHRYTSDLALIPSLIDHIANIRNHPTTVSDRVALHIALASLYRARDDNQAELRTYKQAIKLATNPLDELNLAIVYNHLGKYYEGRDGDRALTYYQNSLDLLAQAPVDMTDPAHAHVQIRLAWLYTLRNDPRAEHLLQTVTAVSLPSHSLLRAELEKTWGEFLRRKGAKSDLQDALTHTHQALLIYEALDESRGIISCYLNLGAICGELRQFEQALQYYQGILALAEETAVDAEILASVHLDLGVIYFYQKEYDQAIRAYHQGRQTSKEAKLKRNLGRAHYNLAEAYYMRFLHQGADADEWHGDQHNLTAIEIFEESNFEVELAYAKRLKTDLFQGVKQDVEQRILPQEQALHIAEMMMIEQNRARLQQTASLTEQIAARLAIAQAYLTISIQERDEAVALCQQHGLTAQFQNEWQQMQKTFAQTQTEQQQQQQQWQTRAPIPTDYISPLLAHLQTHHKLTKRAYADLCQVSLATASKHLSQLTEAGLLERHGQGRSTHYRLTSIA